MKKEEKPNTWETAPGRVDLDARYKGIGISAVAAAVRYNNPPATDEVREDAPRKRSAA